MRTIAYALRRTTEISLFITLLLPSGCRPPCTWPDRVAWEAPRLNAPAFQEGVEGHPLPTRSEPYPWEDILLEYPRRWARAAGLYDLSQVLLPEGVIEVRIWEQYEPWSRFRGTIVQKRGAENEMRE